jgi:AhpD family alkylhydroperoxidase
MAMKYKEQLDDLQKRTVSFLSSSGDFADNYKRRDQGVMGNGALTTKQKELITLLLGVVMKCDDCVTYHASRCVRAKVPREEVVEGLILCAQMGGGPGIAYATKALAAYDELAG